MTTKPSNGDPAEHAQMITDCEARESKLTDWERNFIDDMSRRLTNGHALTVGQEDTLDSIWNNATAGG
jgi:hypothetical protein